MRERASPAGSLFFGGSPSEVPLLQSREFENDLLLFIPTASDLETVHYTPLRAEILAILKLIEAGLE
jgi:hypothetical protein